MSEIVPKERGLKLFTVINKKSDKCYTVYAVRTVSVFEDIEFLVHDDGQWTWKSASDYKPLE